MGLSMSKKEFYPKCQVGRKINNIFNPGVLFAVAGGKNYEFEKP
jgi:hypothetical protein